MTEINYFALVRLSITPRFGYPVICNANLAHKFRESYVLEGNNHNFVTYTILRVAMSDLLDKSRLLTRNCHLRNGKIDGYD